MLLENKQYMIPCLKDVRGNRGNGGDVGGDDGGDFGDVSGDDGGDGGGDERKDACERKC